MDKIENSKRKKIDDIVSIGRLASLLFLAVILINYFFSGNKKEISYYSINTTVIAMIILIVIYYISFFSSTLKSKAKNIKKIYIVENYIFVGLFFIVMMMLHLYDSNYKILFLLVIITATIQCGMKQGLIISITCSILILGYDLLGMNTHETLIYFDNDVVLAGVFILTAWPLGFYVKAEEEHISALKILANKDGLTGIYNHRYFQDKLKMIIKSSKLRNESVSMIFIDIDYFKNYNDLNGHQMGDEVLKKIANILDSNSRKKDVVARYGGEEFAVVLPDTTEEETSIIAERIRRIVENTVFVGEENQPNGKLTISLGISVYPEKAKDDVELIKGADDALYRAKFFNKNKVELYTSILDDLKKDIDEKDIDLVTSVKTLISVINAKDRYTYGHVERVVIYARLLAKKLNLNKENEKNLIYGAYMHDIGKINISREILIKNMPLSNMEFKQLREHPAQGVEIIKVVDSLKNIAPIILHHHERYDGTGYPNGLKGEDIPYNARLLCVVDSFDAMTSQRPYNKRKSFEEAIDELNRCKGTQFDPEITESFIDIIEKDMGKS